MDADRGWLAEKRGSWGDSGFLNDTSVLKYTEDGGRSWSVRFETADEIVSIDFVSLLRGWVSTKAGLLTTKDGGVTWEMLKAVGLRTGAVVDFADEFHGWGEGDELGTLVATSDGGRAWQRIANPCLLGQGYGHAAFSFIDSLGGWVACGFQPGAGSQPKRLYGTQDGGGSWQLIAESYIPHGPTVTPAPDPSLGVLPIGGYINRLFFLDSSYGWLSLSRVPALMATDDGGHSWESIPLERCDGHFCEVDGSDAISFVSDTRGFWVSNTGYPRAYSTSDGGETSTPIYPETE